MKYLNQIKQRMTPSIYYMLILFLPVFYSYYNIWNTLFIADAWHMLDSYILIKDFGISYFFQLFAMPYGIHFLPIGVVLSSLETYLFGVNTVGYGLLSLALHFLNVIVIYYSVKRTTKSVFWGILAGIFFGVNYEIHEGVFWFASNIWTELSTTMVLMGLLNLIKYYQKRKTKFFFISYIFFTTSLFLREYTFMLFPLNMLFFGYLSFEDKKNKKKYLSFIGIYLFNIIGYLILRIFFVYAINPVILSSGASWKHFPYLVLWYIFTLPIKILSNILIPEHVILFLTNFIAKEIYFELPIAQSDVFQSVLFFDQLYLFFGFLLAIILMITIYLSRIRNKTDKIIIGIYGLVFITVPMIFLTLSSYLYWTFSRYLYLPAAIFSIFLFSLLSHTKIFYKTKLSATILFCIFLAYAVFNAQMNHAYFTASVELGNHRRGILSQLSEKINFKNKNQIIFIKVPGTSYKNDTDIFDIGTSFGKVLIIWTWYQKHQTQNIPSCLFDPMFLFNANNGYKYCNGKGYGYFQNIDTLKKTMKTHKISPSDLHGFEYDIKTSKITDISEQLKNKLHEDK